MTSFRRVARAAVRVALVAAVGAVALGCALGYRMYRAFESDLPARLDVVTDYRPLRASQVFSADGEMIGQFYVEKRVLLPVDAIPLTVRRAFVAAEDARFYSHGGIDYLGVLRAAWANLRAGRVVQGGSTITQQVAKLLLVGRERSLSRKVREAMLAHRIEARLGKDQILGIYLNHVYLGQGAYGIAAAAGAYFGKEPKDLSVAEAAMLAGLPKAPGRATPFRDFPRAQARQRYVIDQMRNLGFLSEADAETARREALVLVSRGRSLTNVAAPYFVETIRRYIADNYGDEELLERGLRVYTTLDMRRQRVAEAALRGGLEDLQRRLGFAGPVGHLDGAELRKLLRGRPRPFGPAGYQLDDAETDDQLLLPEPRPAIPMATIDATQPGNHLPEPMAKYVVGEARAARRAAEAEARAARSATKPAAALPAVDPDTTYAAAVVAAGPHVVLASGASTFAVDPADEARLLTWQSPEPPAHARIAAGDVLPVRFHIDPGAGPRGRPRLLATLANAPAVQGALIALDPRDGHLLSMVGGYDYGKSQFNRAFQAHRQIGSAIKPFIYAAAVDRGMTEMTIKYDAPVKFKTASGVWAPHNYKREYLGPLTLRTAIAKSINTVSAQLVAEMGVDAVVDTMRRLGVRSPLPHALSLALGTADLTLQEVAYGLATFPAGGELVTPLFITRLLDADGRVLEEHAAPPGKPRPRPLSAETAYIVTDMMKGVVEIGTAKKARELGRPAGGKTGTSTNYRDAWFFGFTPELLCGVWIGRDDFKPIAHDATGGQVALPVWLTYMREALRGVPARDFPVPPGILFARADPERGLAAPPAQKGSRLVPFKRGTLPPAFKSAAYGARFSDAEF
ncbi:MAG TPA: PBP1A family penicillin-binding protein [Polyangia bacterium]|nr:PBP1A family penicillin-binding protein [Polyangia bacterium]